MTSLPRPRTPSTSFSSSSNWSTAVYMHPSTYLMLSREQLHERQLEAEAHTRARRLVQLRRRERQAERATTRARLARLALG